MPQGRDVCYKKGQAVFQVWQNNGFIQLRETGHVGFFEETLKREPRRHLAVEMEYKMCEVHNKFKALFTNSMCMPQISREGRGGCLFHN